MNFLLKIVEGPMKGAEIALVEGVRVRIGSGEDCDIVLADAALPAEAFALDVKPDAVSFIRGDEVRAIAPFEIFESGASAFAIGPAEGPWEPLRKPAEAKPEKPAEPAPAPHEAAAPAASEGDGTPADAAPPADAKPRRRGLVACCCGLVVLLAAAFALWYFWPKIAAACPQAETARVAVAEKATAAWQWSVEKCRALASGKKKPAVAAEPGPSLADLAAQYNLTLTNITPPTNHYPLSTNHYPSSTIRYPLSTIRYPLSTIRSPLLRGNFARRTERMAVRALALAADPTVKLELTDDESLAAAAGEILFIVTEDEIRVAAATNGIVALTGYAPSAASLERTLRAMNDDVPGLRNVRTADVRIGGVPPPKPSETKQVFAEAPQQVAGTSSGAAAPLRPKKKLPSRLFPIAGILTTPYRTVVLDDGMRVSEGGSIGGAVVERIEPDQLVLREGSVTFKWKP